MTENIWDSATKNFVIVRRRDVAVVRIDRPSRLNALTEPMRRELADIFRTVGTNDSFRGLVLTGTGRAFCAGEDLYEAQPDGPDAIADGMELFHDLTRAAMATTVPVVAALNGIVVGGAAELTLCFDARVASTQAEYFFPENHLGLTISNACSYLLPRLAGRHALDIILSSCRLDARGALRHGLVDEIVAGDVVEAAIDRIERWTPQGSVTAAHLALLRPDLALLEEAFSRETAIAIASEPFLARALTKFHARER